MYDWNQTPKNITIKFPIPYKVDSKKLDTQITEAYLKLNVIDPKIFCFVDFYDKVDLESANIVIEDKQIVIFINKESETNWPHLESKLSKEELKKRRVLAEENYIKKVNENRQKAQERKKDLEKFVIDKSMKIDAEKRNELREKKTQEKTSVEKELYDFVKIYDQKDLNNIKSKELQKPDSRNINSPISINIDKNLNSLQNAKQLLEENNYSAIKNKEQNHISKTIKNKDDLKCEIFNNAELGENEEIVNTDVNAKNSEQINSIIKGSANSITDSSVEIYKNTNKYINSSKPDKEIFEERIVEKNKYQIRNESKINVNLTEKKIPHFAARESLSKEPPYPKSKKFVPEKNHVNYFLLNTYCLKDKYN